MDFYGEHCGPCAYLAPFFQEAAIVAQVRAGLAARGGYCPCRREIKEEYKCMCQEFKDQIADPNFEEYCHCMLYYKEK